MTEAAPNLQRKKWHLWPLVRQEAEWSVPDNVLIGLWHELNDQKKLREVFYDTNGLPQAAWVQFLRDPRRLPVLVVDEEGPRIVLVAWIADLTLGRCSVHQVFIGPFSRGASRTALGYWDSWDDEFGEPMFRSYWGLTPEWNDLAVRVARVCGFKEIGRAAQSCYRAQDDTWHAGVISQRINPRLAED